jgi:hypothetical protein
VYNWHEGKGEGNEIIIEALSPKCHRKYRKALEKDRKYRKGWNGELVRKIKVALGVRLDKLNIG